MGVLMGAAEPSESTLKSSFLSSPTKIVPSPPHRRWTAMSVLLLEKKGGVARIPGRTPAD
jgi:hypothetical protein